MSERNNSSAIEKAPNKHIFKVRKHLAQYNYGLFKRRVHVSEQPRIGKIGLSQKMHYNNNSVHIDLSLIINDTQYNIQNKMVLLEQPPANTQPVSLIDNKSQATTIVGGKQSVDWQECQDFSSTVIPEDHTISSQAKAPCKGQEMPAISRSDKKNVVKNFMKAFKGYLVSWGDPSTIKQVLALQSDQELSEFRKNYQQYEKKRKYNNKFMKEMILNSIYKPIFRHFLEFEAGKWLDKSLVQDKSGHQQMLQFYISAFSHPENIEKIKILKCKEEKKQ